MAGHPAPHTTNGLKRLSTAPGSHPPSNADYWRGLEYRTSRNNAWRNQPGVPAREAPPEPASILRRTAACLIDTVLVVLPSTFILLTAKVVLDAQASTAGDGFASPSSFEFLFFFHVLATYLYATFMQASRRSTVGKRLLGMRVVSTTGTKPSLGAAAVRNLYLWTWAVPVLGGWLLMAACVLIVATAASNTARRGFHDQWSRTLVVRTGRG